MLWVWALNNNYVIETRLGKYTYKLIVLRILINFTGITIVRVNGVNHSYFADDTLLVGEDSLIIYDRFKGYN